VIAGAAGTVSWAPRESAGLVLVLTCAQQLVKGGALPAMGPGPVSQSCEPSAAPTGDAGAPAADAGAPTPDAPARDAGPPRDAPPAPDVADAARTIRPLDAPAGPPREDAARVAPVDAPPPPDAAEKLDRPRPPPPETDLTAGMVAYFRLDELPGTVSPRDSAPGASLAVINLDPSTAWVPGFIGSALQVGGRGWLEVRADKLNTVVEAFTIALFVNRTGDGTLVSRRAVGARGFLYRFNIAGGTLAASINSSNGARADLTTSRPVPARQWVHVAAVYDRMTLRLYLDGQNVGEQPYELAIGPENSALFVGGSESASQGEDLFFGSVDEVLLYNRALSAPEVGALAAGFVPKVP
jgi:Concanavalin A-like lectin/glucanases superfamily